MDKMIVGNLELCSLPELGIFDMAMRVDTGAKTSSLHVDNIEVIKVEGKQRVKFDLHPDIHNVNEIVECHAKLRSVRSIKSSNGSVEQRYVIVTMIELGGQSWPIEFTLTDRSDMSYLMLFGRQGMSDKVLVDPSKSFMLKSMEDVNDFNKLNDSDDTDDLVEDETPA